MRVGPNWPIKRIVVWWSAGGSSTIALKLAIDTYGVDNVIAVYCDTGAEHPDNKRFMQDVERWLNIKILIIKNKKYNDVWEVWEKGYLVGPKGSPCTNEMKRKVRHEFEDVLGDLQIFGYDVDEINRAKRFSENNNEIMAWFPLIEHNKRKEDILAEIQQVGIDLPVMYKLGYRNNNCIGCVKGTAGYWNKIKKDFPDVFERMSQLEQKLDVAINKSYAGDGKRKRIFLKDLPEDMGRYKDLGLENNTDISCGLFCGQDN